MTDDAPSETSRPVFIEGGAIPPGVLDPDIAQLRVHADAQSLTASGRDSIEAPSRALWRGIRRRLFTPIGALDGGGEIGQRRHEVFAPDHTAFPPPKAPLIRPDRREDLEQFEVGYKTPQDRERDHEIDNQLAQVTPQFFLRNISRVEAEITLPFIPFQVETWRNQEEYKLDLLGGDLPEIPEPELIESFSMDRMKDFRDDQSEVLDTLDWHTYHGRWRENLSLPTIAEHGYARQHVKGRFASKEERDEEKKRAAKKRQARTLPPEIQELFERMG